MHKKLSSVSVAEGIVRFVIHLRPSCCKLCARACCCRRCRCRLHARTNILMGACTCRIKCFRTPLHKRYTRMCFTLKPALSPIFCAASPAVARSRTASQGENAPDRDGSLRSHWAFTRCSMACVAARRSCADLPSRSCAATQSWTRAGVSSDPFSSDGGSKK